ncbi:NAC domain-containing protein JA2L [Cryptomeria japonica]|uniref:NAC domain-containing protein JA2L n=1 Tax=Cryptomeria japonica TaxID=3369 RepID=UPI0025AD4C97|nr:NAC domain-containing protein JA2L [Cryptomeria japonica]
MDIPLHEKRHARSIYRGGDSWPFPLFSRLSLGCPKFCSFDSEQMDSALLPGFTFNPTEEDLVFYYLKRKNSGVEEKLDLIPEVSIYKWEPWDLPERSFLPKCNKQWYFFSPWNRKYPSGSLSNRATEAGYWRTTRRYRTVHSRSTSTGVRKTLSFYKGRPPCGEKTEWMMHEYSLDEKEFKTGAGLQNAFVLCHVLKKNELPEKCGGLQSAEIEKCDSSPKNKNPSCNEDRSSLPHMTEDPAEHNMWLGSGKDKINQQVDSMPNGLGSNCECGWLPSNINDFPQVPADISLTRPAATDGHLTGEEFLRACQDSQNSSVDQSFCQDSFADISNGDYIELKDLESCDSSPSFDSIFNNGGPGIQLRPRSPALHSYHQDVSSEGTSKRSVCTKLCITLKLQQDK